MLEILAPELEYDAKGKKGAMVGERYYDTFMCHSSDFDLHVHYPLKYSAGKIVHLCHMLIGCKVHTFKFTPKRNRDRS